jgi:putative drug exporter of the RND superfamily
LPDQTLPSHELHPIGFTVAFGMLLDTIVVRSVLVTALNLDLGHRMWWPPSWHANQIPHQPNSAGNALPPCR